MNDNQNWKVKKTAKGHFLLEYMPGILGENGALVRISEEVYKVGLSEGWTLKELFDKYKLSKNEVLTIIKPTVKLTPRPKINTLIKYQGVDFFVTQEDDKYFLEYRLARHGDGSRKFEITKEIYQEARTGKYATSDLFKKYNLYHLDVPENDIK